jgi:DNA-binding IclR family transcriptional regulator
MNNLLMVNKPKRIQALQRGMAVLEAIAASPDGMRLQDIAAVVGITPGAIHHIVDTFVADGYVTRGERPVVYRLGPALIALTTRDRKRSLDHTINAELLQLAKRLPSANVVYCESVGWEFRMMRQVDRRRRDTVEALAEAILPPYTSAASLIHAAWWPHERLSEFILQRPFATYGTALWGSREHFEKKLLEIRKQGYVDLPLDNAAGSERIGVPVLRGDGALVGSITLSAVQNARGDIKRALIREGRAATKNIQKDAST